MEKFVGKLIKKIVLKNCVENFDGQVGWTNQVEKWGVIIGLKYWLENICVSLVTKLGG